MRNARPGPRHRSLRAVALLTLACSGLPTMAAAQTTPAPTPTPAATPTPQELFRQGEDAYRIGRYDDAIRLWEQAYSIDPRPAIKYNLAQAYERAGRLEDAVAALEIYVREGSREDIRHAEANARLGTLRNRLAETGATISGAPAGGTISIDDQEWGLTPRPDRIPLPPGAHRLEIVYPNGQRYRYSFSLIGGQALEITVNPDDLSAPTVVDPADVGPPPEYIDHTLLYVGAGVAAVGVGVLGYGFERQSKVSTCEDPSNFCANLDAGRRQRSLGLSMGAVGIAGGAALIVVDLILNQDRVHRTACVPTGPGAMCTFTF